MGSVLPYGYDIALAGCAAFAMGVVLDPYWRQVFGRTSVIEGLLAPTRLLAVVAGMLVVGAPLRAALARRDAYAKLPALISAGLLLSALAFLTQFAQPLVDPWPARGLGTPAVTPPWVALDLGVADILLQSLVVTGMAVLLVRSLRLPFGGLTLVVGGSGLLIALLKGNFQFIPGVLATGLAADLLITWLRPARDHPLRLRILAAAIASLYATTYLLTIVLVDGTSWSPTVLVGSAIVPGVTAWFLSYVVLPFEGRVAGGVRPAQPVVAVQDVKVALDLMHDTGALAASPLVRLPCLKGPPSDGGAELRGLLSDVIKELAASHSPRDAESGRILLDYYVRRVGGHEVVMEPMHLSRQTYFRRLDKGKALVAERLDELSELAEARV
jgi:hypothetical protein